MKPLNIYKILNGETIYGKGSSIISFAGLKPSVSAGFGLVGALDKKKFSTYSDVCIGGSRGTSPIIWKENGGESSMTQSTAAPTLCVWHAGGEAGGDGREMTLI